MQFHFLIALLLSTVSIRNTMEVEAFAPSPAFVSVRPAIVPSSPISKFALCMAGAAQPEVETKTKTTVKEKQKQKQVQKKKEKVDEPTKRREDDFEDAPMYKLMLLADDGYETEHVVNRMMAIMEDLDEDAAVTVFEQAQQNGKAMCGKYPFERAELFKEQLIRSDPMIFADMEEENA